MNKSFVSLLFILASFKAVASTPQIVGWNPKTPEEVTLRLDRRDARYVQGNPLDFLISTIESGFCQLDQNTYCQSSKIESLAFETCSPKLTYHWTLEVSDLKVLVTQEPQQCIFSDRRHFYGRSDYIEYFERQRSRLERLCQLRRY